jgi:hypothetical protein
MTGAFASSPHRFSSSLSQRIPVTAIRANYEFAKAFDTPPVPRPRLGILRGLEWRCSGCHFFHSRCADRSRTRTRSTSDRKSTCQAEQEKCVAHGQQAPRFPQFAGTVKPYVSVRFAHGRILDYRTSAIPFDEIGRFDSFAASGYAVDEINAAESEQRARRAPACLISIACARRAPSGHDVNGTSQTRNAGDRARPLCPEAKTDPDPKTLGALQPTRPPGSRIAGGVVLVAVSVAVRDRR